MRISLADARIRYGEIVDGKWADEGKWCASVTIPDEIALNWINKASGWPTKRIYCNKDVAAALLVALGNVASRGLTSQLKTFDGCFMVRSVRGLPGSPSTHSYALAIDMNVATNQLGTPGDLSDELAQCFIDAGFTWGKTFHRQDPQHFSYAWE